MDKSNKIKQLTNSLQQKEKELYSIQRIGRALSSTLKLDELLLLIMKEITEMMDADRSTLYLVDRERREIWSKIALKAEVREIRLPIGQGIFPMLTRMIGSILPPTNAPVTEPVQFCVCPSGNQWVMKIAKF